MSEHLVSPGPQKVQRVHVDNASSIGGGTQYTENDTDTSITGVAAMAEGPSDTIEALQVDASGYLKVNVAAGGAGDGAILDGVTSSIKATVKDYTNSNPLAVVTVDTNGDYVSGSGGTQYTEDAAAAANPVGTALILVREDARAGSLTTTDGDNVAARGNNKGELYVIDTDANAKLTTIDADTGNISTKIDTIAGAVSGTEMQVDVLTMPTTTVQATNLDIRDLTATDVVTANLSATDNAVLDNIDADTSAIQTAVELIDDTVATLGTTTYTEATTKGLVIGAVRRDADTTLANTTNEVAPLQVDANGYLKVEIFDGGGSHTVDNAGTFAVQESGAALTALQLLDDTVATEGSAAPTKGILLHARFDSTAPTAVDDGDAVPLLADGVGRLRVSINDFQTADGNNLYDEALDTVKVSQATAANLNMTEASGSAIKTAVELIDDAIKADDAAFTPATTKVMMAGFEYDDTTPDSVDEGDAGAARMSANRNVYTQIRDAAGNERGVNVTAGNALTVDGSAVTQPVSHAALTELAAAIDTEVQVDVVGALPAGTNAIGKLAANSGVDIGDVTLTAGTEAIGKLLPPDVDVTTHTNYIKKYYTSAGAATDGIIWSPAAGKRWHVVSMFINISAAATITLEDDLSGGDSAVMKMELAANSGTVINFSEMYPLASGEDAADLLITTTAGNVYVTCTGYEI